MSKRNTHHKGVVERVGVPAQLCRMERDVDEIRHENGHKVADGIDRGFRDAQRVLWREGNRPLAVLGVGASLRCVAEVGELRE